jgi:AcrR family transcriptional regulator
MTTARAHTLNAASPGPIETPGPVRMRGKARVRPRGRPRSFDVKVALDRALEVFGRKGYEGASLSDLTKAMRINRPSLYAAFGDKEALFRKALDCYVARTMEFVQKVLREKSARRFVERLLRGAAELQTDPRHPPGCLTVHGALACGEESEPIRKELICRREQVEAVICDRLKRAKKENDLPASSNPSDLARYVVSVIHGMAVQASAGASRVALQRVVETALRAWPRAEERQHRRN